jgi:hypothetical protein
MFYIYHAPGVKIGCSQNIKKRMQSQKFTNYEILEEHYDVFEASNREIELQKQYGYKVDRIPYWMSLQRITKAQRISAETKEEWLPNVDWKARDANTDFQKRAEKIMSHPNWINRKIANGSEQLKKVLLQYDLDGNFIKEWDCGVRNMKEYGLVGAGDIARKEKGTIHGYQWRYKKSEHYPKQIGKFENQQWQKVIQKDKNGNIIKIWDNVNQAILITKATGIYNCLYGKSKTAKGFIWEKI